MKDKIFDPGSYVEGPVGQQANDIRETLHGIVNGVAIDFRHELLVPGVWKPYLQWHMWGDCGMNISILLPEEGVRSDTELREVKGISPDFPIVRAEVGDNILVVDAFRGEQDRVFDHPHDREYRFAQLMLRKADGSTIEAPALLAFAGSLRVRDAMESDVFDNVLERIRRHIGVASLNEQMPVYSEFLEDIKRLSEPEKEMQELCRHAHAAAQAAYHSYAEIETLSKIIPTEHRAHISARLRRLQVQQLGQVSRWQSWKPSRPSEWQPLRLEIWEKRKPRGAIRAGFPRRQRYGLNIRKPLPTG